MGCSSCRKKYRGATTKPSPKIIARTSYVRKGTRIVKAPEKQTPEILPQPKESDIVPVKEEAVDPSTGWSLAVMKEGSKGETEIPNRVAQPETFTITTAADTDKGVNE